MHSLPSTGSRSPDLTAGNAYSSIVPNYVNSGNPEESIIYTQPNPDNHISCKYTRSAGCICIHWITQGAKAN